jgi:hypothetical protein
LADALRLAGQLERAHRVATGSMELGVRIGSPYTTAWAHRVLGDIALADGALSDAESYLSASYDTFVAIQSRFEAARTRLSQAELAHARGELATASACLSEARAVFAEPQAPRYVERTERLAAEWGIRIAGQG